MPPLKSLGVRLLRTVVPAAWSAVLLWLASQGLLSDELRVALDGADVAVLLPIVLGAYYAATAAVEDYLSQSAGGKALLTILAGYPQTPEYKESDSYEDLA